MGRIFIDGFESGNLALWNVIGGVTVTAAQTGMDDVYNASFATNVVYLERSLPSKSEVYAAFRFRLSNTSTPYSYMIAFKNASTNIGCLRINPAYYLEVSRGTTYLATGPTLSLNTTYKIEIRFKPHNTDGVFQVKVNGLLVIDFSGDTTDGATTIDNIRFGYPATNYGFLGYLDNVVIDDTSWPGDTRIKGILPAGVGNSSQWTPSAGSNYACVDEVPPSDADYVTTNTVGNKDTYAAGDLPADASSVKCVQFAARAQKEGAATPQNLAFVIRTGGMDYEGSGVVLPTTFTEHVRDLWVNNPATSQAFTPSEVNGMEIGIKAAA